MADLAIWMAGHIAVPIYPTLSAEGVRYILGHSKARAVFVGKLDTYDTQRHGIDATIPRISFPIYGLDDGLRWNDLLSAPPLQDVAEPGPESTASIMYSSGTTGMPKGVMIPFRALDFVGRGVVENLNITGPEQFFSYLPLSHIAEMAYLGMGVIYSGSSVAFTESLEKFSDNLQEIQPTVFGGVPRIFAKFQEGVLAKMPQKKLSLLLSLPLINSIVKKAIRKKLGLSRAFAIVGGAAPIPVALLEWFAALGIEIREMYGMTENCGYSHGDHGATFRLGTVGRPWQGVEAKLGDDGEILMRHPGLMTGYFNDPQATAQVFTTDGFLKTGDKGVIDHEGFLTITGRIKDQFKTDKAKFIAPAPIENKLLTNGDIAQACVVGMGIPQPIALVVLSAAGKSKSKSEVVHSIAQSLQAINPSLEHYERIEKAVILEHDWTIENGLMTPSLKVKRNEIEKIYLKQYPVWYAKPEAVVWE